MNTTSTEDTYYIMYNIKLSSWVAVAVYQMLIGRMSMSAQKSDSAWSRGADKKSLRTASFLENSTYYLLFKSTHTIKISRDDHLTGVSNDYPLLTRVGGRASKQCVVEPCWLYNRIKHLKLLRIRWIQRLKYFVLCPIRYWVHDFEKRPLPLLTTNENELRPPQQCC